MQPPDADLFYLRGEYREIAPPERLGYIFEWEDPDPDDVTNIVTLTFEDALGGTRVVLDHGPFATEDRRALHEAGWTDGFERLEKVVTVTRR